MNLVLHPLLPFFITSPNPPTQIQYKPTYLPSPASSALVRFQRKLRLRCSSGSEGGDTAANAKDLVSGMLEEQVESLLRKEENRHLLDGIQEASRHVDLARQELAEIQRQEVEFSHAKVVLLQLQKRESEIAECQRELSEARVMVEEAEQSLSINMDQTSPEQALKSTKTEEINEGAERWESIKSASIASLIGTLAGFPIALYEATSTAQLLLHLAVISMSCALFGVTFRYTIRRDLDNIQLKTGTAAAFGFVRGLATMEAGKPLEFDNDSYISHAIDGAVYVSGNILIFLFSAIALDFCFKTRILSTFPIKK